MALGHPLKFKSSAQSSSNNSLPKKTFIYVHKCLTYKPCMHIVNVWVDKSRRKRDICASNLFIAMIHWIAEISPSSLDFTILKWKMELQFFEKSKTFSLHWLDVLSLSRKFLGFVVYNAPATCSHAVTIL